MKHMHQASYSILMYCTYCNRNKFSVKYFEPVEMHEAPAYSHFNTAEKLCQNIRGASIHCGVVNFEKIIII